MDDLQVIETRDKRGLLHISDPNTKGTWGMPYQPPLYIIPQLPGPSSEYLCLPDTCMLNLFAKVMVSGVSFGEETGP